MSALRGDTPRRPESKSCYNDKFKRRARPVLQSGLPWLCQSGASGRLVGLLVKRNTQHYCGVPSLFVQGGMA
jgi:hypothetical protein